MLLGSVWYHLTTRGFFCRIWRGSVIAELAGIVRCDYLVSVYTVNGVRGVCPFIGLKNMIHVIICRYFYSNVIYEIFNLSCYITVIKLKRLYLSYKKQNTTVKINIYIQVVNEKKIGSNIHNITQIARHM